MTETAQKICGCEYVKPGAAEPWYQVAACPRHEMNMDPLDEVPGDRS